MVRGMVYKEKERSLKWQWEATNPCYPEVRSLEEKVVLHLSGTDGPPGCSYLKMEPLQLEIQIHPLQKQQFFRWIKIKVTLQICNKNQLQGSSKRANG